MHITLVRLVDVWAINHGACSIVKVTIELDIPGLVGRKWKRCSAPVGQSWRQIGYDQIVGIVPRIESR